jgi:hypothetical protein
VRRFRIIGICLGAVLALTATAASTAAAAGPAFGQCYAKEDGKYTNASCTAKGRHGSYEWRSPAELTPEQRSWGSLSSPAMTIEANVVKCEPAEAVLQGTCAPGETESKETLTVECKSVDESGTVSPSGKSEEHVALTLYGCTTMGGTVGCSNSGLEEPRIFTEALKGKLGFIDKETNEVGVTLEPELKADIARFTCGDAVSVAIGGASSREGPAYPPKGGGDAIVAKLTPVDEVTNSPEHVYTFNEQLENLPTHLEGKAAKAFEAYEFNALEPQKGSKWGKAAIGGSTDDSFDNGFLGLEIRD